MTGAGTQNEALTAAAKSVPAPELPGPGRVGMPGSGAEPEAGRVRHLVIFRVPVAGFARPAANLAGETPR